MRPLILVVDDNRELADLLTQVLQEAGYRAMARYRGKAALEAIESEPPAAAIVDMLLPDVMGTEVAKALRAKNIPFVFVTGVFKGLNHAREAVHRHGARALYEKPFPSASLIQAVREIVEPPPPAVAEVPESVEVELDIDVEESDVGGVGPLEMTGRIAIGGPDVSAVLTGSDFKLDAPTKGQAHLLRTGPLPTVPQIPEVEAGESGAAGRVQRGALRDNLPQLITAFWQLQESGELWLQRGRVKKAIWFDKGMPVFALSNLASDRFGTFLLRLGRINEDQLRVATQTAAASRRRTGDVLIEMGLLRDAERMYYVAQQAKAIIYSLFAWTEGEYVSSFQARAVHEPIHLGIHPAQMIARGIKKLYRPERLKRLLALEDRLVPSRESVYALADAGLDPWEETLLGRIDGSRTVAELLALAPHPAHMVFATLVVLEALRFVEKAPR